VSTADYLRLLRAGWRIIVGCVVGVTALAIVLTLATPRQYRAQTQVFVTATTETDSANELALAGAYIQARVQSFPAIATSPLVTQPVIDELGLSLTATELADRITATAAPATVLVNLSVTDRRPAEAARIANAVAAQFATVIESVERSPEAQTSRVKVTVTRVAQVPTTPISPRPALNIAVGLLLGLALGGGVALLRGALDSSFKAPEPLAAVAGSPVLATVAHERSMTLTRSAAAPPYRPSESFRQLRTNLRYLAVDQPAPRVIAITSAVAGEGKTTVALNLASALAEAGRSVCLVEADLRRPTLAQSLGLVAEVGVTTILVGRTTVEEALQYVDEHLAVLTSGVLPPNPSELLDSAQTRKLFAQLSELFDYAIVDTAPLLPVSDGVTVASMADVSLLVTRAGKTSHRQVADAVETLAAVGARPAGVVLNELRG
jgi:capsular exopolysaccharide synthesis family protein